MKKIMVGSNHAYSTKFTKYFMICIFSLNPNRSSCLIIPYLLLKQIKGVVDIKFDHSAVCSPI